jgi:hypothetical protein
MSLKIDEEPPLNKGDIQRHTLRLLYMNVSHAVYY